MTQWTNIFKDKNDWNEKTIVGSISFMFIILYSLAIIIGGLFGIEVEYISEVFNSLVTITLGSFGIAEVSKTAERWQKNARVHKPPMERERDINDNPDEKDDYLDAED